jgi:hypothetical protein
MEPTPHGVGPSLLDTWKTVPLIRAQDHDEGAIITVDIIGIEPPEIVNP